MKSFLSILFLCLVVRSQGSRSKKEAKYPRFERTCYRSMPDDELNECLKLNFQQNLPSYRSTGIPGIVNGSIDPHFWPKFSHYFGGSLLQGSVVVLDTYVRGWSSLEVINIRANVKNPQKMLIDMDYRLPKLDVAGRFIVDGNIGVINFHGEGPFSMNLTGVSGTWKVAGSRKKDSPYMEIKSFRGKPKIQNLKAHAPAANFGNEWLGNLIVATANMGWRTFQEIANPAVEREWGNYCRDRLNQVFLSVPYDELFPLNNLASI